MSEIDTTRTWAPGDSVTAAAMNEIIDQAFAEPAIITGQTVATPAPAADYVMFYDASATALAKCKIEALPNGVTSIDLDMPTSTFTVTPGGAITTNGTFDVTYKTQGPNKFLCGPVTTPAAVPTFRVLSPSDLPTGTIAIPLFDIDWNLGVMFSKTLTANAPFTHSNASPGQTIRVLVRQDVAAPPARTITFAGVRWPGGTDPVMTPTAGSYDLFTFHFISGVYFGTFEQNFLI